MQKFTFNALVEGKIEGEQAAREIRVEIPSLTAHGVMDAFDNVLRREIATHLGFEHECTWDWHGIEHGYGWWTLWDQLSRKYKTEFFERHRRGMSSVCNTALSVLMNNSYVTQLMLRDADILRAEFKLDGKESVWTLFNNEYNVQVVGNGEEWEKSEDMSLIEKLKAQGYV